MKRICNVCGVEHDADDMVKDPRSMMGVRPLCKPCKNKQQVQQRKATRNAAARAAAAAAKALAAQLAEEEKAKAVPFIARARTFQKPGLWDGKQEPVFVRNDGHKHILSRGV